jgi:hypothetical protein
MKIERNTAVQVQLAEGITLRTKLISQLTQALETVPVKGRNKKKESKNQFLHNIELSAEGFHAVLTSTPVSQLDRTSSMLAGPFFTCAEYPIPLAAKGMMLPVVQLKLSEISKLSGLDFGESLLQLWCDPTWGSTSRGLVRVVPSADVNLQTLTPFEYEPHPEADNSPLPNELIFDPSAANVDVISGYESSGLQCQTNYFDVYSEDLSEEIYELIGDDLQQFKELINTDEKLHVLGSFYPIQYSAVDMGMNCLIAFPSWGSSGNAQVLYELDKDSMAFSFVESLR